MKHRHRVWIITIMLLLLSGWFIGYRSLSQSDTDIVTENTFRAWFWEQRGLDLIIQVALLFAGALGITALLPEKRVEEIQETQ